MAKGSRARKFLSTTEMQAVAEFQERLQRALPDGQLESLILFGSKARKEAHLGSDIDLLVVLRDMTREAFDAVVEAELETLDHTGVALTPLVFPRAEIEDMEAMGEPLAQNVAREGIVLLGEGIVVKEVNKVEITEELLASAKGRLRTARAAAEIGEYRDAISRLHYAFLDAADAVLVAKGFTPKSHAGTITLFRMHFIKTGLVNKKYGRLFSRAGQARLDADYHRRRLPFTTEEVEGAIAQAQEFVTVMEGLLPSLLEQGT